MAASPTRLAAFLLPGHSGSDSMDVNQWRVTAYREVSSRLPAQWRHACSKSLRQPAVACLPQVDILPADDSLLSLPSLQDGSGVAFSTEGNGVDKSFNTAPRGFTVGGAQGGAVPCCGTMLRMPCFEGALLRGPYVGNWCSGNPATSRAPAASAEPRGGGPVRGRGLARGGAGSEQRRCVQAAPASPGDAAIGGASSMHDSSTVWDGAQGPKPCLPPCVLRTGWSDAAAVFKLEKEEIAAAGVCSSGGPALGLRRGGAAAVADQ